jgi:glycosyltransferase involved in cell wall biosynthesis
MKQFDKCNAPRIVVATDVRFWNQSTGAQRRIDSLVRYLVDSGMEVIILFAGSLADPAQGKTGKQERKRIRRMGLRVLSLLEDWSPPGLVAKAVWQANCIGNWIVGGLRSKTPTAGTSAGVAGKYLHEFANPLLRERFQQMVTQLQPDAVIVQYVTLGFLVPEHRGRTDPRYLLDTHDLLSERCRQFRQYGFDHWIRISEAEEAGVLRRFDTILAIQSDEQLRFQQLAGPEADVILVGHPSDTDHPASADETLAAPVTLGYFGSDNPSNQQALQWFFRNVWPGLRDASPDLTILVAGTVCDSLDESVRGTAGVSLQRDVTDLDQLYRTFRIAVNPVQFGTGLKIKNQEALAWGKPLVVTAQGAAGMLPAREASPMWVAADAQTMREHILELAGNPRLIRRAALAARQYARDNLAPDQVYCRLVQRLQECHQRR